MLLLLLSPHSTPLPVLCPRSSKEGGLSLTHDLTPLTHLTSLVLEARQAVSLTDTVRCGDTARMGGARASKPQALMSLSHAMHVW